MCLGRRQRRAESCRPGLSAGAGWVFLWFRCRLLQPDDVRGDEDQQLIVDSEVAAAHLLQDSEDILDICFVEMQGEFFTDKCLRRIPSSVFISAFSGWAVAVLFGSAIILRLLRKYGEIIIFAWMCAAAPVFDSAPEAACPSRAARHRSVLPLFVA